MNEQPQPISVDTRDPSHPEALRRDRLLAALTLIAGLGLLLGLPFALQYGAAFFLPLTASIVIAIALVPVLEWLERRGLPAPLASATCVLLFLVVANVALASIVVPAIEWFRLLPTRIDRIQDNLAPLLDLYKNLETYVNRTLRQFAAGSSGSGVRAPSTSAVAAPGSIVEFAATSAPGAIIEMFFALLVIYFFLSGWTKIRRGLITRRASFGGAMATARVIQEVVDDTSSYLGTITVINVCLGLVVAGALYLLGMPYPLMWGGIVALFNYIPYFGPILAALLLALGGLMTFTDIWTAMIPAAIMVGAHLVEASVPDREGRPADVDESVTRLPGVRVIPGGLVIPPGSMTTNIDLQFGEGNVPHAWCHVR